MTETSGAMQHTVLSFRQLRAHHDKVGGWIVRVLTQAIRSILIGSS
ncbi:hypothetical protein [Cryobacterium sp. Y62]|nr:hypothetical protein [Cryobacterium sp. Y62]